MKINVGGGFNPVFCPNTMQGENMSEYYIIDKYNLEQDMSIEADAWDIPFENNTVDHIYSGHTLEHLNDSELIPTLNEFYRVLKVGGKLTLHLPDLEYCCRTFLEAKEDDPEKYKWKSWIIFGKNEYPGDSHRLGFTTLRVQNLLNAYPYSGEVINVWCELHNQQEIRANVTKNA